MKFVVQYKYLNCTVDKFTITGTGHTTNYATSILLKIFWCCLLAPVTKVWKQTHLERCGPVPHEQKPLFTNKHPHNWFMPATAQLENLY